MPKSTSTPCGPSPSPGRGVRHERTTPKPRGLPDDPPFTRLQTRAEPASCWLISSTTPNVVVPTSSRPNWRSAGPRCRRAAPRLVWAQLTRSGARVRPSPPRHRSRRTEVPPTDLIVGRSQRATPYPYSAGDIDALMTAAGSFRSPLRACHLRDPRRLAGDNRHAGRRSNRARPQRHRLGQRCSFSSPTPNSARAAWSPCTRARSTHSLPMAVDVIELCAQSEGPELLRVHRRNSAALLQRARGLVASWSDAPG